MSCLYSSPELLPWITLNAPRLNCRESIRRAFMRTEPRCRPNPFRVCQPSRSTNDAFPNRQRSSPADQINYPVETSQPYCPRLLLRRLLLRKSSSAISGFRSRCGREQHSDCARMDLRFGTFQSEGLSLLALPALTRGQRPWTDVVAGT